MASRLTSVFNPASGGLVPVIRDGFPGFVPFPGSPSHGHSRANEYVNPLPRCSKVALAGQGLIDSTQGSRLPGDNTVIYGSFGHMDGKSGFDRMGWFKLSVTLLAPDELTVSRNV